MKIVFLDEYSIGGADLSAIKSQGDYTSFEITHTEEEAIERCQGAEIVIVNKVLMTRRVMSSLPSLRLICVAATGTNNIDHEAAAELGIEVRNAAGYSTNSVAEATLSSALSLSRSVSYYDRYIKSGDYSKSDRLFCFDRPISGLAGRNWGIIGLGAIGRQVANLANAFGCNLRYLSTSGAVREESVERANTMEELLAWSDVISIHAPLNADTKGLIGKDEFNKMRPNTIIINVARGGIIDERALIDALNSGTIRAAALDVFSAEPISPDSPIYDIENPDQLLLSPHNAWQSADSVDGLIATIAKNIESYIAMQ